MTENNDFVPAEKISRTELILKEERVDLKGSNNAKSHAIVKYGETRVYVHLKDCDSTKEVVWRFEYNNDADEKKLLYLIAFLSKIDLKNKPI